MCVCLYRCGQVKSGQMCRYCTLNFTCNPWVKLNHHQRGKFLSRGHRHGRGNHAAAEG